MPIGQNITVRNYSRVSVTYNLVANQMQEFRLNAVPVLHYVSVPIKSTDRESYRSLATFCNLKIKQKSATRLTLLLRRISSLKDLRNSINITNFRQCLILLSLIDSVIWQNAKCKQLN